MKEKYEKLAKQHGLPSYADMVKHFEIDSIGKDDNVLREIMKKMYEKIDYYTNTLESLIQPEATPAAKSKTVFQTSISMNRP